MRSVKLKESKLNDENLLSKCCWCVPGSGETTLQRGQVGGDLVLVPVLDRRVLECSNCTRGKDFSAWLTQLAARRSKC